MASSRSSVGGTSQLSAMPARSTRVEAPPWLRITTRLLMATASSTEMRTPPNTKAFTNQVVPNRSANCTTFFVSSSRNATPMKKRSAKGTICRKGPPARRTPISDSASMKPMATR